MEILIFSGLQASGKSTFYKENFFNSHVRISMDLLNTRRKEAKFLEFCLSMQQRIVIDNTNPTVADREKYISAAKARKYKVIGYQFRTELADALARNALRTGKERIPDVGLKATFKKLEPLQFAEGFDEIFKVSIENNRFNILNLKTNET